MKDLGKETELFETLRASVGKRAPLVLEAAHKVAVLDRNLSPGHSGIFGQEIRSALSGMPDAPPVYGYVMGIGGRDVRVETVAETLDDLVRRDEPDLALYVGVKGLPIGPLRAFEQIPVPVKVEVAR